MKTNITIENATSEQVWETFRAEATMNIIQKITLSNINNNIDATCDAKRIANFVRALEKELK